MNERESSSSHSSLDKLERKDNALFQFQLVSLSKNDCVAYLNSNINS